MLGRFYGGFHFFNKYSDKLQVIAVLRTVNERVDEAVAGDLMHEDPASVAELIRQKEDLKAYFASEPKSVYFTDLENKDWFQKTDCFEVFEPDYLEFRYNDSEVFGKKQDFMQELNSLVENNFPWGPLEHIKSCLGDPDLREELAYASSGIYTQLGMFDSALFWLDCLCRKYPDDQFLAVKRAELYLEMGAQEKLEELFAQTESLSTEHLDNVFQMVRVMHLIEHRDRKDDAMEVCRRLEEKRPEEVSVNLLLLFVYLRWEYNLHKAHKYYRVVGEKLKNELLVFRRRMYYVLHQKCDQIIKKNSINFEDQIFLEGSKFSKKSRIEFVFERCINENPIDAANNAQFAEYDRARRFERARWPEPSKKGVRESRKRRAEVPAIGEFSEAFREECVLFYLSCAGRTGALEHGEGESGVPVGLFYTFLEKVSVAESRLLIDDRNYPKILRWCNFKKHARTVAKFEGDLESFKVLVQRVLDRLVVSAGFEDVVRGASEMKPFWTHFFDFANLYEKKQTRRSEAQRLGVLAAIGFIKQHIARAKISRTPLDLIVRSVRLNCEMSCNHFATPSPRILSVSKNRHFYSGFLRAARDIFSAAGAVLLSRPVASSVMLFRVDEQLRSPKQNLLANAVYIRRFFGCDARLVEIINSVFDFENYFNFKLREKVEHMLSRLDWVDFQSVRFLKSVNELSAKMGLPRHSRVNEVFGSKRMNAAMAGSICGYYVLQELDFSTCTDNLQAGKLVDVFLSHSFEELGAITVFYNKFLK